MDDNPISTKPSSLQISSLAFIGLSIRLLLINSRLSVFLSQRNEISTPFNSWTRAVEGSHLIDLGLSPYSGDVVHEYPISLYYYRMLIKLLESYARYTHAFIDVATAVLLYHSSIIIMQTMKFQLYHSEPSNSNDKTQSRVARNGYKLTDENINFNSKCILIGFLFSPLSLMGSIGTTTSTYTNFIISLLLYNVTCLKYGKFTGVLCGLLASHNIFYSIILPSVAYSEEYFKQNDRISASETKRNYYHSKRTLSSIYSTMLTFIATIAILLGISFYLDGYSFAYLEKTYIYAMLAKDRTPNIGMFWYFYTELFENYVSFFVWIVQINYFVHFIPLCVTLRSNPVLALYITLMSGSILQPYPSLIDFSLVIHLLPLWTYLFQYMRYGLITACTMITCFCLCPIFWHLWIMMYTANANFYFGSTLAFKAGEILLQTDLLTAYSIHRKSYNFKVRSEV